MNHLLEYCRRMSGSFVSSDSGRASQGSATEMSRRSDDGHGMLGHRRTYTNYHDLKGLLPMTTAPATFVVECIYCGNKHTETGEPNPLILTDRRFQPSAAPGVVTETMMRGQHWPMILPCGHLMGWSCMAKDTSGRCQACGTLWRRNMQAPGHCSHYIGIPPLRLSSVMTDEEADFLIPPGVAGGHVPERCRHCATCDALRELTRQARRAMPGDASCAYATDGTRNGFLEGDELKPFTQLDIAVTPPTIPEGLVEEARRREREIWGGYEGRTPRADGRVASVAGRMFIFKVAAMIKPAGESR